MYDSLSKSINSVQFKYYKNEKKLYFAVSNSIKKFDKQIFARVLPPVRYFT